MPVLRNYKLLVVRFYNESSALDYFNHDGLDSYLFDFSVVWQTLLETVSKLMSIC